MTDVRLPTQVRVIGPALDQATFAQRKSRAWGKPSSLYASSLHLECLRQLYWMRIGKDQADLSKAEWLRNASTGSSMHENYQGLMELVSEITAGSVRLATSAEVLEHAGLTIDDFAAWVKKRGLPEQAMELPIPRNPKTDIGGRGDIIVRLTGTFEGEIDEKGKDLKTFSVNFDNELVVVEIKTMKHKDWTSLPKNRKWKKYYAQIQAYLHFYKIHRCIVFAVCRDDDQHKEMLITYDPAYVAEHVIRKAEAVKDYVQRGVVPPATFGENKWDSDCTFCPFKQDCDLEEMLNGQ